MKNKSSVDPKGCGVVLGCEMDVLVADVWCASLFCVLLPDMVARLHVCSDGVLCWPSSEGDPWDPFCGLCDRSFSSDRRRCSLASARLFKPFDKQGDGYA